MSDNIEKFNLPEESDQVRTLKRLAILYHATGDYQKADEILNIAEQWREGDRAHRQAMDDQSQNAA
jgi:hypothetical protein